MPKCGVTPSKQLNTQTQTHTLDNSTSMHPLHYWNNVKTIISVCTHATACMSKLGWALRLGHPTRGTGLCVRLATPLTLPVDIHVLTEHLTGNVHTVVVVPDVAGVTLCHLITLSLWHSTGTVELHYLWLFLDTHSVTQYRETRHLAIF